MGRAEPDRIAVEVIYASAPGAIDRCGVDLPAGSTLRDAIAASGLLSRHPGAEALRWGVHGRVRQPDARLRDGDRVEVYRPLQIDPKEARRLRQRQRGAKTA